MTFNQLIATSSIIKISQKRELAELLGVESRNKYLLETVEGEPIGYAAEKDAGVIDFFLRQSFGHWRSFEVLIFDNQRQLKFIAKHPFRFYFQRIEIYDYQSRLITVIQKRFSFLSKCFDVLSVDGKVLMSVSSPFWRIWTFEFFQNTDLVAIIRKKWGGIIKETFLDADSFTVEFQAENLKEEEKITLIIAAIFVDLLYFERKASSRSSS